MGFAWHRVFTQPRPSADIGSKVQLWISGDDGRHVIHEDLYLVCLNREAEPGFGHTDQVNFAFRLLLGPYQELCRAYPPQCAMEDLFADEAAN